MKSPHPTLRPHVVQNALRKTTEALANALACPTEVTPNWSEFEWRAARAAAAIHGVAPLLATSLRWQGPSGWTTFLAEQRAHTESRHRRIEDLTSLIDGHARGAGVAIVALKGAALHTSGVYAAGERPMADLDLLVRASDLATASELLEALGFRATHTYWKNRVFVPRESRQSGPLGEHGGNDIKIELHWCIREKLPLAVTDISELVFPAAPRPGLNDYPSRAALTMHLVVHAAGAMVTRTLRLLQLNDLARLARQLSAADWNEVLRLDAAGRGPWWALPPLRLTAHYFPDTIPVGILAALAEHCPAPLRLLTARQNLTDVSLSNIWVQALPGIEWSQSAAELLQYVAARIRPGAEALTVRKADAAAEAWATQGKWDRLSQSARIAHWLTSRPTRPGTMYVVRASLVQPQ